MMFIKDRINKIILLFASLVLMISFMSNLAEAQTLTNIDSLQEITIDGVMHKVFSAYDTNSVQGIYHTIIENNMETTNPIHVHGQNNSHPKIILFDDKIYVVWQGWVEFPPQPPGSFNPQPQYTIHYKYYENDKWSLPGVIYSGFSFENLDTNIFLEVKGNVLQTKFFDYINNVEKTEILAEIEDVNEIGSIQELDVDGAVHQVFSAYDENNVQGIYYNLIKDGISSFSKIYVHGQNNSHPKIILFDDKIYVVWQGWVEFPPQPPGSFNPQPQYTIHYKYYENDKWSLPGVIYSGFSFENLDTNIFLEVKGNVLQTKFFDYINNVEKTSILAESYDSEVESVKTSLTYKLILNGNADKSHVVSNLYLPTNLSDVKISWNSSNASIVSNTGAVTRNNSSDKEVILTASLKKGITFDTKEFTLNIKKQILATAPDPEGKLEIGTDNEVVVDNSNAANLKQIVVPDTVADNEDVVVNLVSLVDNNKKLTLGLNNLTLSRNSNTGVSYSVEIPSGTIIQGESNWNGLITIPTVKANTEVTIISGTPDLVVEVGSTGVKLTFDKAVKLNLPDKAEKSAGYAGSDGIFNTIDACTISEIANPDTLPTEGNCYTTSGNDMIIWTKHFTKFAAYTPSSSSSSSNSGSGPSGGKVKSYKVIDEEPTKEETKEILVVEPVRETPEVTPIPLIQPTPIQKEQGFFDSLTGAVIGATSGKKGIASIFIAAITIVGILGVYYKNIKRKEKIRKQIESLKK